MLYTLILLVYIPGITPVVTYIPNLTQEGCEKAEAQYNRDNRILGVCAEQGNAK